MHNAALRCEQRLAILERSENAKRCESLLNALLAFFFSEGKVPFSNFFHHSKRESFKIR